MDISELTNDQKECLIKSFKESDFFDYYTWMNDDLYDTFIGLSDYWLVKREKNWDDYKFSLTAQWKKAKYDIEHPKSWLQKNCTLNNILVFLTLLVSIWAFILQIFK